MPDGILFANIRSKEVVWSTEIAKTSYVFIEICRYIELKIFETFSFIKFQKINEKNAGPDRDKSYKETSKK